MIYGSFNNYVTLLVECLDVPTSFAVYINHQIIFCCLAYPNMIEYISFRGPGEEDENGKSTNNISDMSNLDYYT